MEAAFVLFWREKIRTDYSSHRSKFEVRVLVSVVDVGIELAVAMASSAASTLTAHSTYPQFAMKYT